MEKKKWIENYLDFFEFKREQFLDNNHKRLNEKYGLRLAKNSRYLFAIKSCCNAFYDYFKSVENYLKMEIIDKDIISMEIHMKKRLNLISEGDKLAKFELNEEEGKDEEEFLSEYNPYEENEWDEWNYKEYIIQCKPLDEKR